jgi:hypothetical protein
MKRQSFRFKILGIGTDAKTSKGVQKNVLTGVLYLAPARESGVMNTCPNSSAGCRAACLFTAGMGKFKNVKKARINKTIWFAKNRENFLKTLQLEIKILEVMAAAEGMAPAVRLNGTSDIHWERYGMIQDNPNVQFYDYTKNLTRALNNKIKNYHLTFSKCESNHEETEKAIKAKKNVAIVFHTHKNSALPKSFMGVKVVDGDIDDTRFLDGKGVIVGLRAKGRAKYDTSGFVVQV